MKKRTTAFLSESLDAFLRIVRQERIFMVGVACVIGFTVGVAAVLFKWMIFYVHDFFYNRMVYVDMDVWSVKLLWIPVALAIGGLLVGLMNHFLNPGNETGSVAEAMKWAAVDQGVVPSRVIWFRSIASALTIGSGGSAGREGPIVQMGAAIGSVIGRNIKASHERIRLLCGCGTAAAIAAAFNAPLGGLIFAIEVVLGDFNIKVFSPLIFASVIATVTARHLEGDVPVFELPAYTLVSTWEIVAFVALGVICGILAAFLYKTYFMTVDILNKLKLHPIILPAFGGMLVGLIAIAFPDILGNGYDSMNKVLTGKMTLWIAFALVFVKIIATSITLGSKGSGGKFAPALFVGSMAGGAFGAALNYFFPESVGPSGSYALVGMGAVMAAIAHAPLTNILMVFELTNNFQVIVPIMVACISSSFVYSYFWPNSIYMEELRLRGITLWEGREAAIMGAIKVKDVMTKEFEAIPETMPFKKIQNLITKSKEVYFPCVDDKGKLTGVLSVQDMREFMFESGLGDLVIAKEIATDEVISVYPDDDLNVAMDKFAIKDLDELPVIAHKPQNRVVGILKRIEVMNAYKKAVLQART
ncbi:MAG: chloride channel protein [Nitrospinota bacterium]